MKGALPLCVVVAEVLYYCKKMQTKNLRRFASSLIILALLNTDADAQAGTLIVKNNDGAIFSRVGCEATLACSGIGSSIAWMRGRNRVQNDTNKSITTWSVGNEQHITLAFKPVLKRDQDFYGCAINRMNADSYTAATFVLRVADAPLKISPRIQNVDISQYHIGEVIIVGCPVETCTEKVTVTFLRGDDIVGPTVFNDTQQIHTLNLLVDEETAGTYACKVDIDGATTIQEFTLTGTPLPPIVPQR